MQLRHNNNPNPIPIPFSRFVLKGCPPQYRTLRSYLRSLQRDRSWACDYAMLLFSVAFDAEIQFLALLPKSEPVAHESISHHINNNNTSDFNHMIPLTFNPQQTASNQFLSLQSSDNTIHLYPSAYIILYLHQYNNPNVLPTKLNKKNHWAGISTSRTTAQSQPLAVELNDEFDEVVVVDVGGELITVDIFTLTRIPALAEVYEAGMLVYLCFVLCLVFVLFFL